MTNLIRKAVLLLGLALLVAPHGGQITAMEDYPRTSGGKTICALIENDPMIPNPEEFGCEKRSAESKRGDQCIPVFDEERHGRGRACSFLKSFGTMSGIGSIT